jgi:hypothetical protein
MNNYETAKTTLKHSVSWQNISCENEEQSWLAIGGVLLLFFCQTYQSPEPVTCPPFLVQDRTRRCKRNVATGCTPYIAIWRLIWRQSSNDACWMFICHVRRKDARRRAVWGSLAVNIFGKTQTWDCKCPRSRKFVMSFWQNKIWTVFCWFRKRHENSVLWIMSLVSWKTSFAESPSGEQLCKIVQQEENAKVQARQGSSWSLLCKILSLKIIKNRVPRGLQCSYQTQAAFHPNISPDELHGQPHLYDPLFLFHTLCKRPEEPGH